VDYFYSPGFGGTAAVVAAGAAYLAAALNRRQERQGAAKQQCFDRFVFILDHQTQLGPPVVLAALIRLSDDAVAAKDSSLSELIDDFTLTLLP